MWPRWLRALTTVWVAWDSKKRKTLDLFWVIVVLVLGPFMVPFYMTFRPLINNEKKSGGLLWNIFINFEKLFSWLFALAAALVFTENMIKPASKDIAEVKRAEIKAGSILGIVFVVLALGLEKIGVDYVKRSIDSK